MVLNQQQKMCFFIQNVRGTCFPMGHFLRHPWCRCKCGMSDFTNEVCGRGVATLQCFYLIGKTHVWWVCGLVGIKEQTPQQHMFKGDWTISSNIIKYSTLNIEPNCKEKYMFTFSNKLQKKPTNEHPTLMKKTLMILNPSFVNTSSIIC